jgi:hypothetical protein
VNGKSIDKSLLTQQWVHSHEEDTPTTTVYRPSKFPFPPARGRKGFHLQRGGKLTALKPGPTDQTVSASGTWKLGGEKLELAPKGESPKILEIESVEPDRLVVKKTPSA